MIRKWKPRPGFDCARLYSEVGSICVRTASDCQDTGGRMRNWLRAIPAIVALCVTTVAQNKSPFEVFGGYSLERIAPCGVLGSSEYPCNGETGFLAPATNFNGWNAALTGYLKFLGATADFSGHYGRYRSSNGGPTHQPRAIATCSDPSSRGGRLSSHRLPISCSDERPRMFNLPSGITMNSRGR